MNVFEIIRQTGGYITDKGDFIIFSAGIALFGIWLLKTSLGRTALIDSPPRRNNMPPYMPFIPLFIWFGFFSLATSITKQLWPKLPEWQTAFFDNLFLCISGLIGMAVIIFLVRTHFARRLKGIGLNMKTAHKDLFFAFVNLLSVWPVLMAVIILTTFLGKFFQGQDFQLQPHKELQLVAEYTQLPLRVLIIITTIAVVPVFEELLFRGLFQTTLRSLLEARYSSLVPRPSPAPAKRSEDGSLVPWSAIAISSGIFALIHSNADHWPALFVLSVCMGYAYEKSGSLLRPIFIHSLFNATSVLSVLIQ